MIPLTRSLGWLEYEIRGVLLKNKLVVFLGHSILRNIKCIFSQQLKEQGVGVLLMLNLMYMLRPVHVKAILG